MHRPDAIVVGGGIAGIAAALHLAQRGAAVTLLETRPRLGGRATSFKDNRTGEILDNCQHVALGCCTNYLALCDMLGVGSSIGFLRDIHWVEAGGRVSTTGPAASLPAPAAMGPSLLGAAFLSLHEKAALGSAMTRALRTDRSAWADRTFDAWLDRAGQPERVRSRFWEPLIISACNAPCARVSAAVALHVVQEGFLAHRDAPAIGVATAPLVELYDAAEGAIAAAGGEVRLRASVRRIGPTRVETASGDRLEAPRVVCALPAERAARFVDEDVRAADDRFRFAQHLEHAPILGVHLAFDEPVLELPAAVLVDRPTQWVFRKDADGRRVHAVISAAWDWLGLREEESAERVLTDLRVCFPAAMERASLVRARAVNEKLATWTPTPAFERSRPAAVRSDDPGGSLVLAGDYTRTGWPATMESAARSGAIAAARVLGIDPDELLAPALRPATIVRALGAPGLRDQHTRRFENSRA